MKVKLLFRFVLAFAISSGSLHAVTLFTDSFESPVLTSDDTFTSGNMPNWTKTGGAGNFGVERLATSHFNNPYPRATDGQQVAYSNGGGQTFTQSMSFTLQANTQYTLSLDIGDRNDTNFTGYVLQLFAGSTQLAIDNNSVPVPDGGWATSTITYTSSASDPLVGQTVKIQFQSLGIVSQTGEAGAQTVYDNLKLTAIAVPEPATWALLLGGAGALLVFNRRGGKFSHR